MIKDCHNKIKNNILKYVTKAEWAAAIISGASGTVLSGSPELAKSSPLIFIGLLIGQIIWASTAAYSKKWPLFWSSMYFVALNIYGIYARV